MTAGKRRLLMVGLVLVFVLAFMAGAAARPVTVRSDVTPQTTCWCYWNSGRQAFCYRCCDVTGCRDVYCDPAGC